MSPNVRVLDLASVLEIGFAANFLLIFMEIRPLVERQWLDYEAETGRRFEALWRRILNGQARVETYVRATLFQVAAIALDALAVILSAINSVLALGLLISGGFNPDATLLKHEAKWLLWLLFLVPAVYAALSAWLPRAARRHAARTVSIDDQ